MSNREDVAFLEEQTELKSQKTFKWCLQPLIFWFNLLGIPLASSINNRHNSSFCSLFKLKKGMGLLIFIVNLGRLLTLITFMILESFTTSDEKSKTESTRRSSFFINLFNQSFIALGSHLALIISTLSIWNKSLVFLYHHMEKRKFLKLNTFRRFRSISQWGLAFMLIVNLT